MHIQGLLRIPKWLAEAKYVWFALLVILLACIIALRSGTSEPIIRLTGLGLQILGIGTVAWGIAETRALYGHKPIHIVFAEWALRFPMLRRSAHTSAALVGVSATFSGGSAVGTVGFAAGATLEQRIEALEKNIPLIHGRITAVEVDTRAKVQKVVDKLSEETRGRKAEDEILAAKLESTATGGVHISAIGAVWLLVGVTFSTAGIEIQQWLR